MTNTETKTQAELYELEQRFGPGLGQYVYDQLIRTDAVNANKSVEHNHKVPESSYYYKKAA